MNLEVEKIVQIGRFNKHTHGQSCEPLNFGYILVDYFILETKQSNFASNWQLPVNFWSQHS
jgi:hypothetical protein